MTKLQRRKKSRTSRAKHSANSTGVRIRIEGNSALVLRLHNRRWILNRTYKLGEKGSEQREKDIAQLKTTGWPILGEQL